MKLLQGLNDLLRVAITSAIDASFIFGLLIFLAATPLLLLHLLLDDEKQMLAAKLERFYIRVC